VITDNTSNNNLRTFETNAMKRAQLRRAVKHPLFSGSPIMWNGILVRKMQFGIRFNASDAYKYVAVADKLTAAETSGTVASGLSTTHQACRSIFLGAQALALVSGANQSSEETYSMLENRTNFERNLELAGEIMGVEEKLRWSLPNSNGDLEPTDFGVMVIDSVVKKRTCDERAGPSGPADRALDRVAPATLSETNWRNP
jgi:acetyl-CoA acetyltransferase